MSREDLLEHSRIHPCWSEEEEVNQLVDSLTAEQIENPRPGIHQDDLLISEDVKGNESHKGNAPAFFPMGSYSVALG